MTNRLPLILLLASSLLGITENTVAENITEASGYELFVSQYQAIEHLLKDNPYGVPVYIGSKHGKSSAAGEVFAKINHGFASIAASLNTPQRWCDVLLLHINVKGCESRSSGSERKALALYVGRRYYQTPDEAHEMRYEFNTINDTSNYLHVRLNAGEGPLGTKDYLITFEAIPYDESTSIIRFRYSYHFGLMARLALDGYLATIGRHKVGFTITQYDESNNPVYIKGLQGIVERNAMRYVLAIQSYLDSPNLDRQRWDQQIQRYNQLASRFERQFIEIREKEYMAIKRKEFRNRVSASTTLLKLE